VTIVEREAVAVVLAHFGLPFERVNFDCLEGGLELERKASRSYAAIARSLTMDEIARAFGEDA
jgi:hypothetical protein